MNSKCIAHKRRGSSNIEAESSFKRPNLKAWEPDEVESKHFQGPSQPAPSRGVEVVRFPPDSCRADNSDVEANRRNFILKHKQRLLSQNKLVLPGKWNFSDKGLSLEWESIDTQRTSMEVCSGDVPIGSDVTMALEPEPDLPPIASTSMASNISHDTDSEFDELDSDSEDQLKPILSSSDMTGLTLSSPIIISDDEDVVYPSKNNRPRKIQRVPSSDESEVMSQRSRYSSTASLSSSPNVAISIARVTGAAKTQSSKPNSRSVILRETKHVPIPKNTYARGRRVLVQDKHILTVSMRGDLQYFNIKERERDKALSNPWDPEQGQQRVEDACSVGEVGVISYKHGPQQLSIIKDTRVVPLKATPHRGGVSCVCPATSTSSAIKFFSGGHDHTVQSWTVSADNFSAEVDGLPLIHSSLVHALGFTTKDQLVSASNCNAVLFDVNKCKELMRGPSSNTIYQVHIQPNQPDILATEVKHLDRQVNIYDMRQGFLDRTPVIDMGYRDEGSRTGSRYQRGAFRGSLFVRGYHDGTIKIFDIRNIKKGAACHTLTRREQGTAHTIFWQGSRVLAFGGTMLSFLDFHYT